MKKILVFTDYFSPGFRAGGPMQTLNNVFKCLCDKYAFYLVTKNYDVNKNDVYDIKTNVFISKEAYNVSYLSANEINVFNINNIIKSLNPDIIYLNSFCSVNFSVYLILSGILKNHKIILAPRGEFSKGALGINKTIKYTYIYISNILNLYNNVTFHASNNDEKNDIEGVLSVKNILVAPDIILPNNNHNKHGYIKSCNSLRLCFVSRIVNIKNLDYCILSLSNEKLFNKNIQFDIYGIIEDKDYWQYCQDLIIKNNLSDNIVYKGEVLPNTANYVFSNYDFFFFPTKGENFGHVIYESLSAGTPVIISNTTFWHSLEDFSKHSYVFELSNTENLIDYLLLALKMNSFEYSQISRNAYEFAQSFALNSDFRQKMIDVFES